MPEFTIKNGNLTAKEYEQVSFEFICPKGTSSTVTLDFPVGLIVTSTLNVTNVKCPCCGAAVVLPRGKHQAVNGKLVSTYDESVSGSGSESVH